MSKGPGRIERAIRALFDGPSDEYGGFDVTRLAEHCYPGVEIERKQRVAVLRAANKVIAADPVWTKFRSWDATCSRHPVGYTEFFRRDNPPSWVTHNSYGLPSPWSREKATLTAGATMESKEHLRAMLPTLDAMIEAKRSIRGTDAGQATHTALAAKARALMVQNDPDAVRAGLAEIADALDAMTTDQRHAA